MDQCACDVVVARRRATGRIAIARLADAGGGGGVGGGGVFMGLGGGEGGGGVWGWEVDWGFMLRGGCAGCGAFGDLAAMPLGRRRRRGRGADAR